MSYIPGSRRADLAYERSLINGATGFDNEIDLVMFCGAEIDDGGDENTPAPECQFEGEVTAWVQGTNLSWTCPECEEEHTGLDPAYYLDD